MLKQNNLTKYIPWMYGVNGIMSVFGSVTAVILSMLIGFTQTFFIGLSLYLLIFMIFLSKRKTKAYRSENIKKENELYSY
jgi:type III secretory pathway component EscV